MNDTDIQLIASLIEGRLPAGDRAAAEARLERDPDFRAAYDEQVAVRSMLVSLPEVSLTDAERSDLRSALRTELHLDEPTVTAPVTASRWTTWWAPLTGLAAAAALVLAFAIIPNLGEGDEAAELVAAEITTTAAPSLTVDPMGGAEAPEAAAEDSAVTTTAAASGELFLAEAQAYRLAEPLAGAETELPVVEEEALGDGELEAALSRSQTATIDLEAVRACFPDLPEEADALVFTLTAVTPEGVIVGVVTDPDTGDEVTLTIDLNNCTMTSAG